MEDAIYKKTPLYSIHKGLGARMVKFAGWEMPIRYGGVINEHCAVRERAGLFDVSHMREITVEGEGALLTLQRLTINDVARLNSGEAQYTVLVTEEGTCIDDLIVLKGDDDKFLLVVNASNKDADFTWIDYNKSPGTVVRDVSDGFALLALQGPCAEDILGDCCGAGGAGVEALKSFTASHQVIEGVDALVSRTGYTGEDGFELMVPSSEASKVWTVLMYAGKSYGLTPCGLGARDSLRLEAGLPLYGNELGLEHTVLEANLGRFLKLDKPVEFFGKAALLREKAGGSAMKLVGFVLEGRSIARHGFSILSPNGDEIGKVTSGGYAPTLAKSIGMGYVAPAYSSPGTRLLVEIRGKGLAGEVVKLPFYRRSKKGAQQ